jgi:hypothetical protein
LPLALGGPADLLNERGILVGERHDAQAEGLQVALEVLGAHAGLVGSVEDLGEVHGRQRGVLQHPVHHLFAPLAEQPRQYRRGVQDAARAGHARRPDRDWRRCHAGSM